MFLRMQYQEEVGTAKEWYETYHECGPELLTT